MPIEVSAVFALAPGVIPIGYPASSHERCRSDLAALLRLSWTASSNWSQNRSPEASALSRQTKGEFIRNWSNIDQSALTRLLSAAADLSPEQIEDLQARVKAHPSAVTSGVAQPST